MEKLHEVVARVFDLESDEINYEMAREVTEEWDSFNHLLLIHEIEKEMGIKFAISEVEQIKTLKDLELAISKKL